MEREKSTALYFSGYSVVAVLEHVIKAGREYAGPRIFNT
jgi:hypothetical protein